MDDSAADNDAAFVALVEELDSADDERRGKLARQLEADGAVQAAPRMAGAADARPRWAAARIMHLLPDEAHLDALVPLVDDPEPRVASAAWRALRGQVRNDAWRAAVERIADDGPPERREDARRWLSES